MKLCSRVLAAFFLEGLLAMTAQAQPAFPASVRQRAPNVVWILLDDVGFGAASAFGGLIRTPTLDALAGQGLRYSNFHVPAYCAPTRAALYPGVSQIFGLSGPILKNRSFSITTDVEIPAGGAQGALFAFGGRFNGLGLYIQDGRFHATRNNSYNDYRTESVTLQSHRPLPSGRARLRYAMSYTAPAGNSLSPAGLESLYVNDEKVDERPILKYESNIYTYDEGMDVGRDLNTPVSDQYSVPFEFTGKLHSVIIEYE